VDAGISEGLIRAYLRGSSPGTEKLAKLARVLGVSLQWLANGSGDLASKRVDDRVQAGGYVGERGDLEAVDVPIFEAALSAGNGHSPLDPERQVGTLPVPRFVMRDIWRVQGRPVAVRVTGTSMLPTFHDGALVIVDCGARTIDRDGDVYALAKGSELFVKRVFRTPTGDWVVRSDNPKAPEFTVRPEDHVEVLGRIAGSVARPPE
jgi:phage repressor protein C with HTH and peptisase S24 domain